MSMNMSWNEDSKEVVIEIACGSTMRPLYAGKCENFGEARKLAEAFRQAERSAVESARKEILDGFDSFLEQQRMVRR